MGLDSRGTPGVTQSMNAWVYTVEERLGKSRNAWVYTVEERLGLQSRNAWIYSLGTSV